MNVLTNLLQMVKVKFNDKTRGSTSGIVNWDTTNLKKRFKKQQMYDHQCLPACLPAYLPS